MSASGAHQQVRVSAVEGLPESLSPGEDAGEARAASGSQSGEPSSNEPWRRGSLPSLSVPPSGARSGDEDNRRQAAQSPLSKSKRNSGGNWFDFLFKWRGAHKHRNAIQLAQAFGIANQPGKPGPVIGIVVCKGPRNELQGLAVATPRVVERYLLDGRLQQRVAVPEPLTCFVGGKIGGVGRVLLCGTQGGRVFILKAETFEQLLELDSSEAYSAAGVSFDAGLALDDLPPRGGLTFSRDPLGRGSDAAPGRKGNGFFGFGDSSAKREKREAARQIGGSFDGQEGRQQKDTEDGSAPVSDGAGARRESEEERKSSEWRAPTEGDGTKTPAGVPACLAISSLTIKSTFAEFVHFVIAGNVRGHVFVWQVPSTKLVHLLSFPGNRAEAAFLVSQESLSSASSLSRDRTEDASAPSAKRPSLSPRSGDEAARRMRRPGDRSGEEPLRAEESRTCPHSGTACPERREKGLRHSSEGACRRRPRRGRRRGSFAAQGAFAEDSGLRESAGLPGESQKEAEDFFANRAVPFLSDRGDSAASRREEVGARGERHASVVSVAEAIHAVGSVAEIDLSDGDTDGEDAAPLGGFADEGSAGAKKGGKSWRKVKKASRPACLSETPDKAFFGDSCGARPDGAGSPAEKASSSQKSKGVSKRGVNAKKLLGGLGMAVAETRSARRDSGSSGQASVRTLGDEDRSELHTPADAVSSVRQPAARLFQSEEQHGAWPRRDHRAARESVESPRENSRRAPRGNDEERFQSALEDVTHVSSVHGGGEFHSFSPQTQASLQPRTRGECEGDGSGGVGAAVEREAEAGGSGRLSERTSVERLSVSENGGEEERRDAFSSLKLPVDGHREKSGTSQLRGRETSEDEAMEDVSLASDCPSPGGLRELDFSRRLGDAVLPPEMNNHGLPPRSAEESGASGDEGRRADPEPARRQGTGEEARNGDEFGSVPQAEEEEDVPGRVVGGEEIRLGTHQERGRDGRQEVPRSDDRVNGRAENPRSEERLGARGSLETEMAKRAAEEASGAGERPEEITGKDCAVLRPSSPSSSVSSLESAGAEKQSAFPGPSPNDASASEAGREGEPSESEDGTRDFRLCGARVSPDSGSPEGGVRREDRVSLPPSPSPVPSDEIFLRDEPTHPYLNEHVEMTSGRVDEAAFSDEASEAGPQARRACGAWQSSSCVGHDDACDRRRRTLASQDGDEQRYVGALLTVAAFDQLWIGYGDGTVAVFALSDYCLLECSKLATSDVSRMEFSKYAEVVLILSGNQLVTVWSVRTLRCLCQVPTSMLTCGMPLAYLYVLEAPEAWDSKVTILLAGCMDGSISVRRLEKSADDDLRFLLIRNYVREVEPQVPISAICIDSWLNAAFVGDASGVVFTLPYVFQLLDPTLVPAVAPPQDDSGYQEEGRPAHSKPESVAQSLSSEDLS
ncbi:conserved hypothetical protein [Neospora caninum Liverpool]|uniref:Uncharacterized protein n=1 Tax=Neospora caninum (strain Liverpool) TaxID=572307 RepID=F0VDX6_NEOCL|nr:conserved hypothetical protein [Neospora caninum Liverpool]CBZ51919.1 conserved hypothetical protein [Neospora caninum Liverpool]CEL65881.1 TPA: hypothetical protein BN1204_017110 [Neospora caninum Liverpool]|eukprot:XP_003881952.1 conserved hypothetical protein [Neospora caninum Liverpool]